MKAVQQEYKTGQLALVTIDKPTMKSNEILVKNEASVVSVGTEKTMIDLARRSLIGKATHRPDLVRRVFNNIKTEGIAETYRQVNARLENPILLGYSSSGIIEDIGDAVTGFKLGDRVACTGSGFASHSEYVSVPEHMCALLPSGVSFNSGAFCALGGIALESIKMAKVENENTIGVIGIGLIGLITIQLLSSYKCKVIAIDLDPDKLLLAKSLVPDIITTTRYDDFQNLVQSHTQGEGLDSIIITASTNSNEPIEASALAVKLRGKVISTGLTGLNIPRQLFYEKELQFAVSKAWGDDNPYQNTAHPTAYENINEFLECLDSKQCDVEQLITANYNINDSLKAYQEILSPRHNHIGIVLNYDSQGASTKHSNNTATLQPNQSKPSVFDSSALSTGVIGAGLYANGTFLPVLKKNSSFRLSSICTPNGARLRHMQKKYNFEASSTNHSEIIQNPKIELAIILTRHDSHAYLVQECLRAKKHVFVEKPLALNLEELKTINTLHESFNEDDKPVLMVGFNRRFSKFSNWAKKQLPSNTPLTINMIVNAGNLNPNSWADQTSQGGRIIGEICHFIDLAQFFTDSLVSSAFAYQVGSSTGDYVINLKMTSGSIINITYVTSGNRRHRREHIEIYCGGTVVSIDNFKKATMTSQSSTKSISSWLSTDRGHRNQLTYLYNAITRSNINKSTTLDPINTTLTSFAIETSILTGENQMLSSFEKLLK